MELIAGCKAYRKSNGISLARFVREKCSHSVLGEVKEDLFVPLEELKFKIHQFAKLEGFGGERSGYVKRFDVVVLCLKSGAG